MALDYRSELDEYYSNLETVDQIINEEDDGTESSFAIQDTTARKHIGEIETSLETVNAKIEALEARTDNDTVYDDTAVKARLDALEDLAAESKGYDDSALVARIEALETSVTELKEKTIVYDNALGIASGALVENSLIVEYTKKSGETDSELKARVYDESTKDQYGRYANGYNPIDTTCGVIPSLICQSSGFGLAYVDKADDESYHIINVGNKQDIQEILTMYNRLPALYPYLCSPYSGVYETARWNAGIASYKDLDAGTADDCNWLVDNAGPFDANLLTLSREGILSYYDKTLKVMVQLKKFAVVDGSLIEVETYQSEEYLEKILSEDASAVFVYGTTFKYRDDLSDITVTENTTLLKAAGVDMSGMNNIDVSLKYKYTHNKSSTAFGINSKYTGWTQTQV